MTFLDLSPHTATAADVRRFQIEQQEDGLPVPITNNIVSGPRSSSPTRATAWTWRPDLSGCVSMQSGSTRSIFLS
jgi:hypothetical protein